MFQMAATLFDQFATFLHGKERILGRIDGDSDDHPVKKLSGAGHKIKVSIGKWVKRSRI